MYRGTTPTLIFNLPFSLDIIDELYITFSQKNKEKAEKTLSDCKIGENSIEVSLSQKDTLNFEDDKYVDIQIRAKQKDGLVLASNIMTCKVERILKDGEI